MVKETIKVTSKSYLSFLNYSNIRNDLIKSKEDDLNLNISEDAKDSLLQYYHCALKNQAQQLVEKLPHKKKGDNIGELKAVTITSDTISIPLLKDEKHYSAKYVKASNIFNIFNEVQEVKADTSLKIRVADAIKPNLFKVFDQAIAQATVDLRTYILPHKTKGENKGDLKIKTIQKEMFTTNYNFALCKFKSETDSE